MNPAGLFEAWIAKIGTGFLSVAALNQSLQSVGSVPQIAEQAANADLDDALNTALQLGLNGFDGPVGAWDAWGNFGDRQFDVAGARDTEPYGAVGFGYRPSEAWRVGAGAHWGAHALDLPILNGRAEGDLWGLSASAAFEPGLAGPRAYAAVAAEWPNTDITRGYLNGITPDKSGGTREGRAYGGAIELGWLLPLAHSLSLMPFGAYQAMKLDLDPYTEESGSFPAHFDKIEHTTQITHAGAELRASIGSTINLWCEADWAHRFDKAVDVTGEVIALNSPFDVPAANQRTNWAEGSIGAGLLLAPGIQAQLRLSAAQAASAVPAFTANVGLSVQL